MGKPFGKASRRTFGRIGTLVPFPCWNSLGVMSSDTLKFSKQPPSEALKGGLPVPARRSACLRRSGFAQAGVSARRRVRFATVRFTFECLIYFYAHFVDVVKLLLKLHGQTSIHLFFLREMAGVFPFCKQGLGKMRLGCFGHRTP